jgi:low affinity Fe/Cu permease
MVLRWFKRISEYLARFPGLPVLVAVGLVVVNFLLQLLPDWPVVGWLAHTHLLLHLGVILGLLGILLGDAL